MLSDLAAIRWGMRGRIWNLWIIQMLGGAFCIVMWKVDYSLSATIIIMIIFSIFCQQACGAHFGIVPFVSRRAYGVVSGVVGAGGNCGAIVTQVIFFAGSPYSPIMTVQQGLLWMVSDYAMSKAIYSPWARACNKYIGLPVDFKFWDEHLAYRSDSLLL